MDNAALENAGKNMISIEGLCGLFVTWTPWKCRYSYMYRVVQKL